MTYPRELKPLIVASILRSASFLVHELFHGSPLYASTKILAHVEKSSVFISLKFKYIFYLLSI